MIQTSHKQTIRPRAPDTCSNQIDGDGGLATSGDVSGAIKKLVKDGEYSC